MSVLEGLLCPHPCGYKPASKPEDEESPGLWGQEPRATHCQAWWQSHGGKVGLEGWAQSHQRLVT